jgi:hypothetical protein
MKHKLTPPRSKRLKLRCVVPLSHFAFKFNLRRYSVGPGSGHDAVDETADALDSMMEAGAYARPLFGSM